MLRKATTNDLSFILELERRPENAAHVDQWSKAHHCAALARDDISYYIICDSTGRRLGYIITRPLMDGECLKVQRIVVGEKSRGIGRKALTELEQKTLADQNTKYLVLYVRGGNKRLVSFYESLGFEASFDDELEIPHYILLRKAL